MICSWFSCSQVQKILWKKVCGIKKYFLKYLVIFHMHSIFIKVVIDCQIYFFFPREYFSCEIERFAFFVPNEIFVLIPKNPALLELCAKFPALKISFQDPNAIFSQVL